MIKFNFDLCRPLNAVGTFAPFPWTAFASGAGGLATVVGQALANSANKKIARETNALNYQMFREQIDANRENWRAENAYNDPSAQLARLRRAGVNVNDMEGNQANAIQTGSPVSATTGAPQQNVLQGLGSLGSDLATSLLSSEQARNMRTQNAIAGIELQYKHQKTQNEIAQQIAELENTRSRSATEQQRLENLKQEYRQNDASFGKVLRQMDADYDNASRLGQLYDRQVTEQEHATYRLDAQSAAAIQNMKAQQAIAWFDAHTHRMDAASTWYKVKQEIRLANDAAHRDWQRVHIEIVANKWKSAMSNMDVQQKAMFRDMLAIQLKQAKQSDNSYLGIAFRYTFGTDLSKIFGGSGSAAIGAAGAMMAK